MTWETEFEIISEPERDAWASGKGRRLRRTGPEREEAQPIASPGDAVQALAKAGETLALREWESYLAAIDEDANNPGRDARGGPDGAGYEWRDNQEPDGIEYEWIDITGNGTRLYASDDWNSGVINLGFTFPYYDQEYSSIRVCSNGWVTLDPNYGGGDIGLPRPLNAGAPNALFLANNYDLHPGAGGSMYFRTNQETQAVVSWIDVPKYGNSNIRTTFQIIFESSGLIRYQYGAQQNSNGSESNVGFESPNGQLGHSIIYREAGSIYEGLCIGIGAESMWGQWVTWDPQEGTIGVDDSTDVILTLKFTEVQGIYRGNTGGKHAISNNAVELEISRGFDRCGNTVQMCNLTR